MSIDDEGRVLPDQSGEGISSTQVSAKDFADLQKLTQSLLQAVGAMQDQAARGTEMRSLVDDVRAAARTIALSPATAAAAPSVLGISAAGNPLTEAVAAPAVNPHLPAAADCGCGTKDQDCGCGPCGCVSASCCMFEIMMTHARVTEMQIEPVDSNISPFAQMEMRFFASIDGVGSVVPNLWQTIPMRKDLGRPGIWDYVGRRIGTVTVCKGQSKIFAIDVEAVEVDDGGIEATAARDEYGVGSSDMVLDCCMSLPVTTVVDIQLNNGGLGGGAVECKFVAKKICC